MLRHKLKQKYRLTYHHTNQFDYLLRKHINNLVGLMCCETSIAAV